MHGWITSVTHTNTSDDFRMHFTMWPVVQRWKRRWGFKLLTVALLQPTIAVTYCFPLGNTMMPFQKRLSESSPIFSRGLILSAFLFPIWHGLSGIKMVNKHHYFLYLIQAILILPVNNWSDYLPGIFQNGTQPLKPNEPSTWNSALHVKLRLAGQKHVGMLFNYKINN